MKTAKDRKAAQEAEEQARKMGLMLCFIYNPAFDHYFVEFKAPDTGEAIAESMASSAEEAFLTCCMSARQRLNLLGVQKYEFVETKPLVSLTDRPIAPSGVESDPVLIP